MAIRARLAHRITPSVDRTDLYTYLQSREKSVIADESGRVKGYSMAIGESPSAPDYFFVDLYQDAIQTLGHYTEMLDRLAAMPRFSQEATPAAVAATSR